MRKIVLNRQLLGLEDFLFGEGTETQIRGGQEVVITKINAANLPFSETQTLAEWVDSTDLTVIIDAVPELLGVYSNIHSLLALGATAEEITEAINKYLSLTVSVSTLEEDKSATASYDSVTGTLTLGIPKGLKGETGPQGLKGDTGEIGPQGLKGDTGETGPQGLKGDTGVGIVVRGTDTVENILLKVGTEGDFWIASDTGDAYSYVSGNWLNTGKVQGPQGLKGEIGKTGPQGLKGDTGPQGLKGEIGETGPQGLKGDTGVGLVTRGADTVENILIKVGTEGDFWIASDTGDGYSYVSGNWLNIGQVRGPQGLKGETGDVSKLNFSDLNNKPTTLNGYGITDVYTKTEVDLITGAINSALDSINGEVI